MSPIQTGLRFSQWALEFMLLPPSLLGIALAAVSFARAGWKQRPYRTHLWRPYHWFALTHLLFFAAAITVGVLREATLVGPPYSYHADRPGTLCLDALMYGSFASCAFWIWRMKGFRWYATSLMALMELPIIGALVVAGMSVTGDWL